MQVTQKELPITAKQGEFLNLLEEYQLVIVVGETGSGKSTQVPQYILESGRSVLVTEPRRLAAISLAHRVAEEIGVEVGDVVGYSVARDRQCTSTTTSLFATDGLALVRELLGDTHKGFDVLVIDEIHEWNLNQEVLVAYVKSILATNPHLKVVIMSATMESEKLSTYFGGAPILDVEGRMYPVEDRTPKGDAIQSAASLLREGRNVLVFQPGKSEIGDFMSDLTSYLKELNVSAEILPLHGELGWEDQQKCFASYHRPKCVVSTNVAQTSVTIPDIDAVVDSGLEKRIELENGVESLRLRPISHADSQQRRGRAGRCKPGVYIDLCPAYDRPKFPVAEIQRLHLDQVVLRLMAAGFDPEKLEFFHQPDKSAIHAAKVSLRALGCLDKKDYLTEIGDTVSKMPVSVKTGRMLVEAARRGVVFEVMIIASILEVGGISDRENGYLWRAHCTGENQSDLWAQYMLWQKVWGKTAQEMRAKGVHVKNFFRAKDILTSLQDAVQHMGMRVKSTGNREDILKSICAGLVEHSYQVTWGFLKNGDEISRRLDNNSIVAANLFKWIVGLPLNIPTQRGTLYLVKMGTGVKLEWLMEIAPQLLRFENGINPFYASVENVVKSTNRVYFASHMVEENVVDSPNHPMAKEITAKALNVQLWNRWMYNPPVMPLPKIESNDKMTGIEEREYGICQKTGVKLIAYGAVTLRPGYSWEERSFQWTWRQVRAEVESEHQLAVEYFNRKREEYFAQREEASLDPIRNEVARLVSNPQFDLDLRDRIAKAKDMIFTLSARELRAHVQELENLCKDVAKAMKKAEQSAWKPAVLPKSGDGKKPMVITGGFANL